MFTFLLYTTILHVYIFAHFDVVMVIAAFRIQVLVNVICAFRALDFLAETWILGTHYGINLGNYQSSGIDQGLMIIDFEKRMPEKESQ